MKVLTRGSAPDMEEPRVFGTIVVVEWTRTIDPSIESLGSARKIGSGTGEPSWVAAGARPGERYTWAELLQSASVLAVFIPENHNGKAST